MPNDMSLKIVAVSDTHEQLHSMRHKIPDGDVFIHCGDITNQGDLHAFQVAAKFIGKLNHTYRVVIAGNHDRTLQHSTYFPRSEILNIFKENNIIYLEDSSVTIEGKIFYGSPWTPTFGSFSFAQNRGDEIKSKWDLIPDDTNILITHGPPYGILDLVEDKGYNIGRDLHQGCKDLLDKVNKLKNIQAHFFGHLHTCGSRHMIINNTNFINAAICTESYKPKNKPVQVTI